MYELKYNMEKQSESSDTEKWVSVEERLPTKTGWYDVRTKSGDVSVPLTRTLSGKLVWVAPDQISITHWKEK